MSTFSAPESYLNAYAGMSCGEIVDCKTEECRNELHKLLNAIVVPKGSPNANIIDLSRMRVHVLPAEDVGRFFALANNCREKGLDLHLMERQYDGTVTKSGIMIDLDIKQPMETRQEMLPDVCCQIIYRVARFLKQYTDIASVGKTEVYAFVLNRAKIEQMTRGDDIFYRDGVHIVLPNIKIEKNLKRLLMKELEGSFDTIVESTDLVIQPGAKEILDVGTACSPIHIYGSNKVGGQKYEISQIIAFKIQLAAENIIRVIQRDEFEKRAGAAARNMCYYMSLLYRCPGATYLDLSVLESQAYKVNASIDCGDDEAADEIKTIGEKYIVDVNSLCAVNPIAAFVRGCLDLLDSTYYDEYGKWFKVLCALTHFSCGSYRILGDYFSRKSAKYNPTVFLQKWSEASKPHNTPLTRRTLEYWAKLSNPEKYAVFVNGTYVRMLREEAFKHDGNIDHASVARVLRAVLGSRYATDVCDEKTYMWYELVVDGIDCKPGGKYKWRESFLPESMFIYMSSSLSDAYSDVYNELKKKADSIDPALKTKHKYYTGIVKNFAMSKKRLYNDKFQTSVINQARYFFRVYDFKNKLDSDPMMLGVYNGVLQLGPEVKLISDDTVHYVKSFIDTPYEPYDANNTYVQQLTKIFRDIYPEDDVFEYIMYRLATGLDGNVCQFSLLQCLGLGSNGKTTAALIMTQLMNGMSVFAAPTLLTSERETAGAANTALMQIDRQRFVVFDEFKTGTVINEARLKSIINNAPISSRNNYDKKQGSVIITSNPFALINSELVVPTMDHATWRRLELYVHSTTFVDHPDPDNPHEKQKIDDLSDTVPYDPKYKIAMLSILTHYYEKFYRLYGGRLKNVPRPTIEAMTQKYRNSQDTMNRFITETIIYTGNADDKIVTRDMARKYMSWMETTLRRQSTQSSDIVMGYIKQSRIGKHVTTDNDDKFIKKCRWKTVDEMDTDAM